MNFHLAVKVIQHLRLNENKMLIIVIKKLLFLPTYTQKIITK